MKATVKTASFRSGNDAEGISAKIGTNGVTKANMCLEKHKDYDETLISIATRRWHYLPRSP